tara:strand:- start:232 stop:735 length:504 start_codon:yes stop_codon:yes gene_type:complete
MSKDNIYKNSMFVEIEVYIDGKKTRVSLQKVIKDSLEEISKVSYKGKKIEPYEDRIVKFYDNMPDKLVKEWSLAYPNVDIKAECAKARVWLMSNTNKPKRNFKRFTNNWLSTAMNNGGSVPVMLDKKVDNQIKKHKEYMNKAQEESATREEISEILSEFTNKMKAKK